MGAEGQKGMHDRRKEEKSGNQTRAPIPGSFSASDLPIDDEGRIYHLQVKPEQIAADILLVGDPGRAEFVGSEFLSDIELEHEHRGLVTVTGLSEITGQPATIISPFRTTVSTSGMGTPSLEIVASELVALNEIDFASRTRKQEFPRLHIIRVGTSGALQSATQLGTLIITAYAIGFDNTGLYYEAPYADEHCWRLERELYDLVEKKMDAGSRFLGKIHPYVARTEPVVVEALLKASEILGASAKMGLTASLSGFFAPQGRDICRVKPSLPDLDQILGDYDPGLDDLRVENMEMEASFLLHFLGGLGYWAGAFCPTIANRRDDTFDVNYLDAVRGAIQVALMALADLRSRDPDARMR
ncbi:MAG: nucleoside phosphorylase [Anaerolineales bacterium]|jgi:uridine phosphorylase